MLYLAPSWRGSLNCDVTTGCVQSSCSDLLPARVSNRLAEPNKPSKVKAVKIGAGEAFGVARNDSANMLTALRWRRRKRGLPQIWMFPSKKEGSGAMRRLTHYCRGSQQSCRKHEMDVEPGAMSPLMFGAAIFDVEKPG